MEFEPRVSLPCVVNKEPFSCWTFRSWFHTLLQIHSGTHSHGLQTNCVRYAVIRRGKKKKLLYSRSCFELNLTIGWKEQNHRGRNEIVYFLVLPET